MAEKIRVLFVSDFVSTGFGTVGKELCSRLAEMEVFDIHYHGWHATPNDAAEATANKINLHLTRFWEPQDQFGVHTFNGIIQGIKPQIVITLGDPWMVEHVQRCPERDSFTWIAYMPIDRDVVCKPWLAMMKKPDILLLFSKFGMRIINGHLPFRHPVLILHGVDRMVFKPWFPEGMNNQTPLLDLMSERKRVTLGKQFRDKFIVGYVGRNQLRKGIPRVMKAFKAFNCQTWIARDNVSIKDQETGEVSKTYTAEEFCRDKQCFRCDVCPAFRQRQETENSVIYLHTTRGDGNSPHDRPGIGWRIDELADRLNLHGRVGMTPNLNVERGIPRAALAQIMNCFDVHLFLSYGEGFGLPIAESIACGVPTIVTDYSSMPELVEKGGGFAVKVHEYETNVTYENELAYADIGEAADRVNDVFKDSDYAQQLRNEARDNDYVPDWHGVASQFRTLILKCVGQNE